MALLFSPVTAFKYAQLDLHLLVLVSDRSCSFQIFTSMQRTQPHCVNGNCRAGIKGVWSSLNLAQSHLQSQAALQIPQIGQPCGEGDWPVPCRFLPILPLLLLAFPGSGLRKIKLKERRIFCLLKLLCVLVLPWLILAGHQ